MPSTIVFGFLNQTGIPGLIHDIYGVNVRKFSAKAFLSAFSKFDAFFEAYPSGRSCVAVLEMFPHQAMAAVPDEETAYPWRDAKGNLYVKATPHPLYTRGTAQR